MTLDMMVKFEKYWTDHSVVLSFGAILDPRLKDKFLKYCYARLDASTCEEKLKNVLDKFRGLYEEYVSYYCNQSTSLSQSLCETSSLSREGNKTKKSKIAIVSFIAFDHIHKSCSSCIYFINLTCLPMLCWIYLCLLMFT